MSDNSTLNALEELIPQIPATFAGNYSALCAAVLLIYDYFLTIPLEIRHIWRGKMNIMKILFILNRYSSLIFIYGQVLLSFVKPPTNTAFYYIEHIFNTLASFTFLCIFTLRSYAIYGRSKTVLFLLAVPALVNLSSAIWINVVETASAFPSQLQIGPVACDFNQLPSLPAGLAELVNNTSAAVFEVLVVIFTVYRTGRLALQSGEAKISKALGFILFRDGVLYYGAIFIPQFLTVVLDTIILETSSVNLIDVSSSLGYTFSSLQIVLINRLVLNLSHAANTNEDDSDFRTRTGLEPLSFASGPVLGNIGGPVRSFPDEDWDDEVPNESEGHEMVSLDRAGSETEIAGPSNVNERDGLDGAIASRSRPAVGETSA